MNLLAFFHIWNAGLVLIYGVFLSVFIAGGWQNRKQSRQVIVLSLLLLLIQVPLWQLLGEFTVERLYPLIIHLPLVLILVFALKKPIGVSIASVLIAYLCCQIPHWIKIAVVATTHAELAGEIAYTICIGPLFYVMLRYFVKPANGLLVYSNQSLLLFGSLPAVYYVFDYTTTVYSELLYAGIPALNELIPTVLILFYVIFLTVHHHEAQKRVKNEQEISAQNVLLTQAQKEMDALHRMQEQTAIYQHDMRHHLNMMDAFLTSGKVDQALDYIRKANDDITSVSTTRFCGNDTVNLICSSFMEKAKERKIQLAIQARLPEVLSISDTELCAILSNALENALNAVANLNASEKWIELYCNTKRNKLLIEIKNPYAGSITMKDGLPVASDAGHGFGCRSIRAIVLRHHGLYTFVPENGIFTLQIVLPTHQSEM